MPTIILRYPCPVKDYARVSGGHRDILSEGHAETREHKGGKGRQLHIGRVEGASAEMAVWW